MPEKFETIFDPALMPVHLQYNMFARDDLPMKNPNPDDRKKKNQVDTMPPEVLTKGIFKKVLEAPSHVILNHANCWTETNPTLAPNAKLGNNMAQIIQEVDDGLTSDLEKENLDKGMTAVSLTLRLNASKFSTITYYKPRVQASSALQGNSEHESSGLKPKTFSEDFIAVPSADGHNAQMHEDRGQIC